LIWLLVQGQGSKTNAAVVLCYKLRMMWNWCLCCVIRACAGCQNWTWIGSIHGLDWIGWDDCDPVLNSNHCRTVDAVSFIYEIYELLTVPVLPRLKVSFRTVSGTQFTNSI